MRQPVQCETPCRACQERHPGCHDECERYKAFRDKMDKMSYIEKYRRWIDDIGSTPKKGRR